MPGQERPWLDIADELLSYGESAGLETHLCRKYVRKNGRMVFGWYLSLSAAPRHLNRAFMGVQQIFASAVPELTDAFRSDASGPQMRSDGEDDVAAPPGALGAQDSAQAAGVIYGARPPSEPSQTQGPPPGFTPRIRVVRNEVDPETGRTIIEEEIPLPHVYHELNRPNERGRGATLWSGKGPMGGRR